MSEVISCDSQINANTLRTLFNEMGRALSQNGLLAEIAVYGGAALLLTYDNRSVTRDVDFSLIKGDKKALTEVANTVGFKHGMTLGWFNDAVNFFISSPPEVKGYGDYPMFDEESGLRIFVATPEYILAMKLLSMRSSLETYDIQDIWNLLDDCGIETFEEAEKHIAAYFPGEILPERNKSLLKDILQDKLEGQEYDPMRYW